MTNENPFWFRLEDYQASVPVENDFDPFGGDLDAQSAWKNFGGLNLVLAYEKFISAPEVYQEDFMFMGSKAFEYYLPIIDRYLRKVEPVDDLDDCAASILGSVVSFQLQDNRTIFSSQRLDVIEKLCSFVRINLNRFSPYEDERRRIDREWAEAEIELSKYRSRMN